MKCRFVYKNGKQFDSELALDEFNRLLDMLDGVDDVQNVYHNVNL